MPAIAIVKLTGTTPFSQTRYYSKDVGNERNSGELTDAYEERTWREKCHYDDAGHLCIPPFALKNMLYSAAKMQGEKIPGKGNSTYTKHFERGIVVPSAAVMTPFITRDNITPKPLFVPSDGKRNGSGSRVLKYFPLVPSDWQVTAEIDILDDIITQDLLVKYLKVAGVFIGLGSLRIENGGAWGRFDAEIKSFQKI
jgi:hypothetical protein